MLATLDTPALGEMLATLLVSRLGIASAAGVWFWGRDDMGRLVGTMLCCHGGEDTCTALSLRTAPPMSQSAELLRSPVTL